MVWAELVYGYSRCPQNEVLVGDYSGKRRPMGMIFASMPSDMSKGLLGVKLAFAVIPVCQASAREFISKLSRF